MPSLVRLRPLGLLAVSAIALPAFSAPADEGPTRPNIVVILADDLGYSDLGCYGGEISTPHLDRLAAEGTRFTQFYNNARCCPTRASLLTGLYPHQAGVGHMTRGKKDPAYQGYLNDRCLTLAETLREAGYQTLMSGKWHVGDRRGRWPVDRGFDRSFALLGSGSNYFGHEAGRPIVEDRQTVAPRGKDWYLTDVFTDRAVEYVREAARKPNPFFLYLSYSAPHWPLHARAEDIARYQGDYLGGWDRLRKTRTAKMQSLGLLSPDWKLPPRDPSVPLWKNVSDAAEWDRKMAVYAAQVDRMDQGIGRVMETLQRTGAASNTLVMFLSDNGGSAESIDRGVEGVAVGGPQTYASYGRPWAAVSNAPFRLYKHWAHEGGIATPFIAWWPGNIRCGNLNPQVGHVIDLMPTCLDAAGATYPSSRNGAEILPVEGRSLIPALTSTSPTVPRTLYWEHEGNRAVRQGRWKLVAKAGGKWHLYNLEADRTETRDLARQQPQIVSTLAAQWSDWALRCGAKMPKALRVAAAARASRPGTTEPLPDL